MFANPRSAALAAGFIAMACVLDAVAGVGGGAPIELSALDKKQLETLVCTMPFNLKASKINGFTFHDPATAWDEKRVMALVECESHNQFRNKPMRYIDDCDFVDHAWSCSPPQLEILVALNGREIKMRPWGLTPEAATQLLTNIGALSYFQGESLDKAIGSSCDIAKARDAQELELKCAATIGVSFWCPQKQITGCPRVLFISHN